MTKPEEKGEGALLHVEDFMSARDGLRLFWQSWSPPEPRSHLVFLHGYGDHSGRYTHFFRFVAERGHAVHAVDYRGHGQSGGRRAYVERFDEYLSDLSVFVAEVRERAAGDGPLFVVGHSLGGLIVSRWLLERPEGVAGAALSSPFLGLAFKPPALKVAASRMLGRVMPFLPMNSGLEIEQLTSDRDFQVRTERDPLYTRIATPRWFNETTGTQAEVMRRASEVVTPLLVLQGGADAIADASVSRAFFESVTAKDKAYEEYAGLRHEIFMEVERSRPMERLVEWLDKRA